MSILNWPHLAYPLEVIELLKKGVWGGTTGYMVINRNGKHFQRSRVIVESLGIKIPKGYVVHHINADRCDDRPENLWVLDGKEHVRYHFTKKEPEVGTRFLPEDTRRRMSQSRTGVPHTCSICGKKGVNTSTHGWH